MTPRPLLAVIGGALAVAAAAEQRLVPEERLDGLFGKHKVTVEQVLGEALRPDVTARAIIYPSFETEYAVGLRQVDARHEIFSVRATKQIWGYSLIEFMRRGYLTRTIMDVDGTLRDDTENEMRRLTADLPRDPTDIPLARCAVAVEGEVASAIRGAWHAMLVEVRPREEAADGVDGVTHVFSETNDDGGTLTGQTWSPDPASRPGKLVAIADAMRDYCATQRPGLPRRIVALAGDLVSNDERTGRR